MQLWQGTTEHIAVGNLWQKTQDDIKQIFHPEFLRPRRFLPRQYLALFQDGTLLTAVGSGNWDLVAEKMFWHRLSGGHPGVQHLFQSFGAAAGNGKFVLWGHEISELLGRGSSAAVYRTTDGYALKVVDFSAREKLRREYSCLAGIKCRNIVRAFDFYESPEGGGMLLETLAPPSCDRAGYLNGVKHLHRAGICHGDIRYTNLGSDKNGTAKLFDLGSSFYGTSGKMQKEEAELKLLLEKFNCSERKNDKQYGK